MLSELDEIADGAVFVNQGRSVKRQTLAEAASQGRRYAITAADTEQLTGKLEQLGLLYRRETGRRATVTLTLSNGSDAARLLRELVLADLEITAFAPATGALEETYLSLETEQR